MIDPQEIQTLDSKQFESLVQELKTLSCDERISYLTSVINFCDIIENTKKLLIRFKQDLTKASSILPKEEPTPPTFFDSDWIKTGKRLTVYYH